MGQYLEAFLLGNGAILGNVCMLPLYPGLLAFLASRSEQSGRGGTRWLGALVLAGVLSLMVLVSLLLFSLRRSISSILPVLLPGVYGAVLLLGVLMLVGVNPFKRLSTAQAPVLRNPYATAYLYGMLLGPMTLPCTGPLIISAFALGAGNAASLAEGLAYFFIFGLGFGWPLVLLPLLASAGQRHLTGWLVQHSSALSRASGALLVLIGLFGFYADVLPNL
ncbi:MAG: hypothetical protein H7Z42_06910 [Roseiflexaceae bacterium]|nr:hypothetical protein [Roseiflexaceae bacterium]